MIDLYVYRLETARPRVQPLTYLAYGALSQLLETVYSIPKDILMRSLLPHITQIRVLSSRITPDPN
jgi:hypothetical protein